MRKSERIMLLLRGGGEWSALEVAAVLGLWFGPYADLHRMEREGKVASRWLDMPYPRRRVYFAKDRDGKMTKQSDAKPMAHPTLACPDSKLAELVSRWEARPQSDAEPVAWRYRYRVSKDKPWSEWALMPSADGKEVCDKYPENYETQGLGVITAPLRPDVSAGLIEAAEWCEAKLRYLESCQSCDAHHDGEVYAYRKSVQHFRARACAVDRSGK